MKSTHSKAPGRDRRVIFTRGLLLVALLGSGRVAVAAAADAPKTHVLFMGVNLALEREGKVRPVVDVGPYNVATNVDGKQVNVPQSPSLVWRITENLKYTSDQVAIDSLNVERAYTTFP